MTVENVRVELDDALGGSLCLVEVVNLVVIRREGIRHLQMAVADGDGNRLCLYRLTVKHHVQRHDVLSSIGKCVRGVFLVARNVDAC